MADGEDRSRSVRSVPSVPSHVDVPVPADLADLLRTPFDAVLTDANRLRIQAALHGLPQAGWIRFTALARTLSMTDGNVSAHLAVLTEVGYATTSVTHTGRRRTTWYAATPAGRQAFEQHLATLRSIADASGLS